MPGGACPGGGCRCPGKLVGAAGELHLQQVWASPPTGVRPSLCFRQPDCRAEACRAHTPSPLASLAQGPCPNLVAPSSDLRLCFSRSLLTPRRVCDVCVGVTESDGLELCCPCGAWFLQVVFLSLPRLLQFDHLPRCGAAPVPVSRSPRSLAPAAGRWGRVWGLPRGPGCPERWWVSMWARQTDQRFPRALMEGDPTASLGRCACWVGVRGQRPPAGLGALVSGGRASS